MGDKRTRLARKQDERRARRGKWMAGGVVTFGGIAYLNTAFEFVENLLKLAGF